MERRFIIAVVLMGLVMVGWVILQARLAPPKKQGIAPEKEERVQEVKPVQISKPRMRRERIVTVEADLYEARFDAEDAVAVGWKLKKYFKKHVEPPEPIDLIPFTAIYCLQLDFDDPELQWALAEAKWEADKQRLLLTEGNPKGTITFQTRLGRLLVQKRLTFHKGSYVVDMDLVFKNLSSQPHPNLAGGYRLRWGPGITADSKKPVRRYGPCAMTVRGQIKRKWKGKEEGEKVLWAALNSRYFAAVIIPDQDLKATFRIAEVSTGEGTVPAYVESPHKMVELIVPGGALPPNGERVDRFRIYVGPKVNSILKKVEAPGNPIYKIRLNQLINYGFFGWLSKIMLGLMAAFHKLTGNYGVAIILLTILIKIVFHPLTVKSLKSSRKMQELQPEIARLRERYRDDPRRLNQAMMKLYKEHGVNPMSGCWPLLLQLPIFWALFTTLRESIELRGAKFIWWIKDLSEPDTVWTLPWLGIPLRILPILMGISMFYQQRISGTGTEAGGSMRLMRYLPLIFTFFFYGFPSGLVLYWLCNNLLTIAQQYAMNRWIR